MIEVVFNPASLRPPFSTKAETLAPMSRLVQTLALAPDKGYVRAMRIPTEFHALELAPGFCIIDWLADGTVRSDEQRLLRQRATRSPFLSGVDAVVQARAHSMDITVGGDVEAAFSAAYLLDAALLSLGRAPWDQPHLAATCQRLDETQGGVELISESVILPNLARPEHYETHAAWATLRKRAAAFDLQELWKQRASLLDRLDFCPAVERQLYRADIVAENKNSIRNRLFELQEFCERWHGGGFDRRAFKGRCDPTSPKTLEDYGASHYTFTFDENTSVVCGWHLRLALNAWRIYFSPDPTTRRISVGHVGEHLPTATQFT